jgi:hypothetical protein
MNDYSWPFLVGLFIWFGFGFLAGLVTMIEMWIETPPKKKELGSSILFCFSMCVLFGLFGLAAPIVLIKVRVQNKKDKNS